MMSSDPYTVRVIGERSMMPFISQLKSHGPLSVTGSSYERLCFDTVLRSTNQNNRTGKLSGPAHFVAISLAVCAA